MRTRTTHDPTDGLRETAMAQAKYTRAVQNASRHLEFKEQLQVQGKVVYVILTFISSAALWNWALTPPLHGAWIPVGWVLLLGTWAGMLWVPRRVNRYVRARRTDNA